jgi:tripartite-type tricarboxylate transporter receptor subunit TctC
MLRVRFGNGTLLGAVIVCSSAACVAGVAFAQPKSPGPAAGDYPSKPIRMVVPSAPGGGTDVVARLVSQALNENLGQAVVVDNRGGAGGIPGVASVATTAAPDGYTVVLGSNGHLSFAPAIYRHLTYDPQKDLATVSLAANQPFIIAVHPSLGVNSTKELIAYAKAHPRAVRYGSGGAGTASHLGTELFALMAGISLEHIPYKGTGPGTAALMGGEIQMLVAGVATILPHARSGRTKALAVTGAKRSPAAPDIPSVAESGVPGFDFTVWYGMVVPGKTPRPIIVKLNAEIVKMLKSPVVLDRYAAAGLEPLSSTPEEFAELLRREVPRWKEVAKAIKLQLD